MFRKIIPTVGALVIAVSAFFSLSAQEGLTLSDQRNAIDSLTRLLDGYYVFPETARQMNHLLKKKLDSGAYASLLSGPAFADQLTKDLQSVSHDKHLNVNFNPLMSGRLRELPDDEESIPEAVVKSWKRDNFGFSDVRILEGNVGYVEFTGFLPPAHAGETAAAVMNFLAGADAIIFDLRSNGGGDPAMIQLLTSYLYPAGQPVHLNNFYDRSSDNTRQTWTLPFVPGRRNPNAEVFVLTSGRTFSAAEEFTYNLKNLKRATIVGETTGGGAHPGRMHPVSGHFVAFIPDGRAINPISGANWEGTGVVPDVEVPADEALEKAHLLAIEKLAEKAETDSDRQFYQWHKTAVAANAQPVPMKPDQLKACAGVFGQRTLIFENGRLFYKRGDRPKMALTVLGENLFSVIHAPYLRLKVEMENGKAVALIAQYDDGREERYERSQTIP